MSNQATQQKKVILGNEYDNRLRDVLKNVLIELGGKVRSHDWGVGGSQEMETMEVEINGGVLTIESETYVGLSIVGESSLVDRIFSIVITRKAPVPGFEN